MPLRDHFHPPLTKHFKWEAVHAAWPTLIVIDLNKRLPERYVAAPRVYLGTAFEIDVGTTESDRPSSSSIDEFHSPDSNGDDAGGVATAIWAPPKPTLAIATEMPEQDEYEVQIFDEEESRIVAAIEIVSPSNKDRPKHRRSFTAKCATLLQRGVSVSIIDLVTVRGANLYGDLMEFLEQSDPALIPTPPPLYAATCRWIEDTVTRWRLETWVHTLAVGSELPTLPLWLSEDLAVPLDLESSYQETCRTLRIR